MKPIQLIISGWGPYPNEERVDFERMEAGSMFLITGATGSGKTTIFDAITYAIYGMVSGKTRDKNSVRSDFAKEETDTFVELIFSHKGKMIRVFRTPRYERKKKRGEGYITQSETAELVIEQEAPLTNLKEVNQRLIEIMGLTYEQYKQIAMVAQGEFMELLLASSKERVEIFRNLFKTSTYERIQKKLTEQAKLKYQEIQALRNRMEEARAMMDGSGDERLSELQEKEHASYEKIVEALSDYVKANRVEIRELEKRITEQENDLEVRKAKGQSYFELAGRLEKLKNMLHIQEEKVEKEKEKYEGGMNQKKELEDTIQKTSKEISSKIESLQKEKEYIQKKLLDYVNIDSEEGRIQLDLEKIKNQKEGFVRLFAKRKAADKQAEQLKKEQEVYVREGAVLKGLKRTYAELEELYKEATIGIVAQLIEEGKPCPVCGSMEHPEVATLSKEVPDEKEVKRWKEKCEKEEAVLEELYQRATKEKGKLEAMEKEIVESLAQLFVTKETVVSVYQSVLSKEEALERQRRDCITRKNEKKNWVKQQEQTEEKLERQTIAKEKKREEAEALRLAMIEKVNRQKTEWETQRAIHQQKDEETKKLSKEERTLFKKLDIETLKEEIVNQEGKRRDLQKEKELKLSKQTVNKNALESIKEKLSILTEKEARYAIYSNLENVTRGNNKDRVVFEHYVLAAYFEDVLKAANLRFAGMTGGRYALMKVRRVMDARTTDSLDLEVLDNYTGKKRSVKTLSGGESFKAALSMALGLSDIVQRNAGGIQVETLFIDEGFGSLDEESLDQALESLVKLSGHNQMIGIISHVNELKERMEHQIVVEKENNGSRILPLA
ncbi:MAG: AAA family ATPase [Velocimicrobium sp.]